MEMIYRGGMVMYPMFFIALALLVCGILHLTLVRQWTLVVSFILLLLVPTIGAAGYYLGLVQVNAALEVASPDFREALVAAGHAEAVIPLHFGFGAALVGLVPIVIGEVRRRRKKNQM